MTCYGPLKLVNNHCLMFIRLASFSDIKQNIYNYELLKKYAICSYGIFKVLSTFRYQYFFQTQCQGHIIIIKVCQVLSVIYIFSYLFTIYIVHVDIVIQNRTLITNRSEWLHLQCMCVHFNNKIGDHSRKGFGKIYQVLPYFRNIKLRS